MADGDGQRVGGVSFFGVACGQECFYHHRHLIFISMAF
jgi:hypothetical protein